MEVTMKSNDNSSHPLRLLLAVDFSDCCNQALKTVLEFFRPRQMELVLLHVIEDRLINECLKYCADDEGEFKKRIFTTTREKLDAMAEKEKLTGFALQKIVCQGVAYREINRYAEKFDVDFVVIGSCGMAGDPEAIFFGGTTERVMRFITKPVFCIPPNGEKKKGKRIPFSQNH
jgi:nucleotide-binding universal stress UspA family protein